MSQTPSQFNVHKPTSEVGDLRQRSRSRIKTENTTALLLDQLVNNIMPLLSKTGTPRLCLTLSLLVGLAHASEESPRFEITPMLGFVSGGTFEDKFTMQKLELDDSSAYGVQLNIRADNQSTWEILYARQETNANTVLSAPIDVVVEKLEFGGTYETIAAATRPYAAATVGLTRFEPQDSSFRDDSFLSFSLGGGVKLFTDRRYGFVIDVRWIAAVISEDSNLFCVSDGGLTCLIQADAGLASQFRAYAGLNARF